MHTARISVNVQYYLYSEKAALLEVNGNYMNEDSWTSFDSGSTTGIESGYGEEIFEFDVDVPNWDDFSLRAYMQPIKHDDTWTPLAKTEPHKIDLNSNFFRVTPRKKGCLRKYQGFSTLSTDTG